MRVRARECIYTHTSIYTSIAFEISDKEPFFLIHRWELSYYDFISFVERVARRAAILPKLFERRYSQLDHRRQRSSFYVVKAYPCETGQRPKFGGGNRTFRKIKLFCCKKCRRFEGSVGVGLNVRRSEEPVFCILVWTEWNLCGTRTRLMWRCLIVFERIGFEPLTPSVGRK